MAGLSKREQRLAMIAYLYGAGTPVKEIAEAVGRSKATVASNIRAMGLANRQPADINPADAKELYAAGQTIRQIAKAAGRSKTAISRALHDAGIDVRKGFRNERIDNETIQRLYVDERLSSHTIAARLGCDAKTVCNRLREMGVSLRPSGRRRT